MDQCKHNWQQTHHGAIYLECVICHERWNTERLVNYLQAKAEGEKVAREALQEELAEQGKYAELGRLALQGLSQEVSVWHCHGNYDSDLCKWYSNGHGCEHKDFCQKRAELLSEVQV